MAPTTISQLILNPDPTDNAQTLAMSIIEEFVAQSEATACCPECGGTDIRTGTVVDFDELTGCDDEIDQSRCRSCGDKFGQPEQRNFLTEAASIAAGGVIPANLSVEHLNALISLIGHLSIELATERIKHAS